MSEWEEYFKRMLEGSKIRSEERKEVGEEIEEEGGEEDKGADELEEKEIREAIKKIKKGKAARVNGIQNEVWIWEGRGVKRAISKLRKRV